MNEDLDEDTEVVVEPPDYAFLPEGDARVRAYVLDCLARGDAAQIDGRILVENCETVFRWLKDGTVPVKPARRAPLKAAE